MSWRLFTPNGAAGNCQSGDRHTGPTEDVAVAVVEGGRVRRGSERNSEGCEAGAVNGLVFVAEEVTDAALWIDPAGDAVVAGTYERHAVLDGAEHGVGEVLPLLGAFAKPAVVGQVDHQVGVVVDVLAGAMGETILEADERSGTHAEVPEVELGSIGAGSESAGDGREPFDERQPIDQRDVFAENDEAAFVVVVGDEAARTQHPRPVEIDDVVVIGRTGAEDDIVGTKDEPNFVLGGEIGDGGETRLVQLGQGGLGPEQGVAAIAQGTFREGLQFSETFVVGADVPNHRLRDAWLNGGQMNSAG